MPVPKMQFLDDNGSPLPGGKLYAYQAGTSVLLDTYSDEALTTPNANPVILDSAGRATVFLSLGVGYKFVLKTSADVTVWSQDNVSVPSAVVPPSPLGVPTGAILMYGAAVAPTGYLLCDGAAVSRTTYAALFAAVGTTYGAGDGSTTFNTPNFPNAFPIGAGATAALGVKAALIATASGVQAYGQTFIIKT
jgi:hypothetical protein